MSKSSRNCNKDNFVLLGKKAACNSLLNLWLLKITKRFKAILLKWGTGRLSIIYMSTNLPNFQTASTFIHIV